MTKDARLSREHHLSPIYIELQGVPDRPAAIANHPLRDREIKIHVYDYCTTPDEPPALSFDLLLNGKKLGACDTRKGFYFVIAGRMGRYRLTLKRAGWFSSQVVESVVSFTEPCAHKVRIVCGGDFIGIDQPVPDPDIPIIMFHS